MRLENSVLCGKEENHEVVVMWQNTCQALPLLEVTKNALNSQICYVYVRVRPDLMDDPI